MIEELSKAVAEQKATDVFMLLANLHDGRTSSDEMPRSKTMRYMNRIASSKPRDVLVDGVKIATIELVHKVGGGEGEGENVERVVKLTIDEHVFYVEFTGFYDSYGGIDWSDGDLKRVYPREVVVTQYFTEP